MQIRQVTNLNDLAALAPQWRILADGKPFLGPDWMLVWWRHFGSIGGRQLAVLVVEEQQGKPVAIAPWFREPSLLHGPTLRFLASGEVCSEYLSIPCREGLEQSAATAIADWLTAQTSKPWDLLHLESVRADDPVIGSLCEALTRRGTTLHKQEAPNCWRVELPDSWEEYLALVSKSHRKRVRRLERAYFHTGRARHITARTAAQWKQGYRILVELHERRWVARTGEGVFDNAAMHAFHRAATAELLASDQLRLSWLELDGRPVAAEYSLWGDGVLYAYQSGMEPDAEEHEPGTLALMATIKSAIAEGDSAVDFLRGDEPYKLHWRAEPRANRGIRIWSNRWQSSVRHALWQVGRSSKAWLRSGRNAARTLTHPSERLGDKCPQHSAAPQEAEVAVGDLE